MFETAELGQKISKEEYAELVTPLREQLLEAQGRLRDADFPVILLFAGVSGGGKGDNSNLLNSWFDPRWLVTRAFGDPSDEEAERPEYWRYWRDLPPAGRIGVFLKAWYSRPLLDRAYGKIDGATLDRQLDRIVGFEQTLVADGAVILKLWMHLGKQAQKRRFQTLEKDPLLSWRVTKLDWKHYRMYDKFVSAAERIVMRTSTGQAPWRIIEGSDQRYRSIKMGQLLLNAMRRRLDNGDGPAVTAQEPVVVNSAPSPADRKPVTVLSRLDMEKKLEKDDYKRELNRLQGELNALHRKARDRRVTTMLVFEGWDASGKGGAIRRLTAALDARDYQVLPIAAPTDEERTHHYLWRFWKHLPRAGRVTLFDRSWYGRVLVERVEGFAAEDEWRRAYGEINDFESQLVDHGIVLVKFWIHIAEDEQERRFRDREKTPHKRFKLTEEDWRNREKWDDYEIAVHDMVERTSTEANPWVLVEGNDKRYARIKVLETVCARLGKVLSKNNGKSKG